ncbi:MAG: formate acetyltransferase [Oscillospiraceae bacterium]|nr:formate acetyltransferase [Oscillospiraceae bacterium]
MRDRVNQLPTDAPMDYRARMAILRERKLEDTQDKLRELGPVNSDDHGTIAPPPGFDEAFRNAIYSNHPNGSWYGYDGYSENFYRLMDLYPAFIDPCDAFPCREMAYLGSFRPPRGFLPEAPYDHLKPTQEQYDIVHGIGAQQHFGIDYTIGLTLGWGGLLEKIDAYRRRNPGHDDFYDAHVKTIRGIQQWMKHALEAIDAALVRETHPVLIANLKQMRECTEHLLDGAPRTLREACNWICWFKMASRTYNGDGAGGQLDELLRPYYEADLAAGRVTRDEAVFYISCLLLSDPHYYQVGGLTADGRDMITYFSYMVLEAADWLDSSCNITVRVHEGMDRAFLKKSVEYLFKNKNGWPRFSGDDALTEGFMRLGYTKELAVKRVAVGCHWMSLPGLEYTLNDCVKTNNTRIFEVALNEMRHDGQPPSVERLWGIFTRHTQRCVETTTEGIRFHIKNQWRNSPELALNLLSHGPIEKGLDMSGGGAEYYNMCIDGTGIATVADSFAALEQRIEREGRLSWTQVYAALDSDFGGADGEYIRRMLAESNRYGGGGTAADHWAERISLHFTECVTAQSDGELKFVPGWFSWSNTIPMGKAVGATPNGRKASAPISHGANPHPGFRHDGALTAMSNAICAIQPGYGNTAPIQLELDPGMARGDEAVLKIVDYIRAIMKQGATLLNINIIDAGRILEADKNPALYPDLVVRVTGFTAYFCMLTKEFRQLVVERILKAS